jgi:multiple sugar transport system substrate-binding protein
MSKIKKMIALAIVSTMMFSLVGCGSKASTSTTAPEPKKVLEEMTKDNITLTYAQWGNSKLTEYLAKEFTKKYPNITVNLVNIDQAKWNDGLVNLASASNLPDAFWYMGNCDIALKNGWLGDMTKYFEADPESSTILSTLQKQGYFDGKKKLAAPCQYLPYTVFLDKNLFKKLNEPMPSADWTFDEMTNLMKKMTVPEQGIYGYNDFTLMLTMAPIANNDATGEFGWNGTKYDMTKDWAKYADLQAEYLREKVHAPAFDTDEAEKAFGDRKLWAASSGRIAMQLDAWWTIDLFATKEFKDKGIDWVPYVVPKGAAAKTLHKPAFVDFGGISSASKHPREAYELLKYMGWGKDGWKSKIDAFSTLKNDDGTKTFTNPYGLPITSDKEVWDGVKKLLPQTTEFSNFLDRAKEPIPLGGASQPGFQTFLDEVYNGGDKGNIEQAIIKGTVKGTDVAQDLTDKLNKYRADAIAELDK